MPQVGSEGFNVLDGMRHALLPSLLVVACGPKIVGGDVTRPDAGLSEQDAGEQTNAYPPGPYGVQEGDVLQNMTFAGYVNMSPQDGFVGDREYVDSFSLQDARQLGYRYLLFNVAAIWCVSCQVEAQELPTDFEEWAPQGGYVLSILKEDAYFEPATKAHLDQWISSYSPNYTMLHDPRGEIDFVLAPAALPTNIMVDLETMEILRLRQGDDPEFFSFFETRLEQR